MARDHRLEIILAAKDISGKTFQKFQGRINKLTKSVFSLHGAFVTLAGGYGLQMVARGFWDTGIKMEQMTRALNAATGSAEAGADAMKYLRFESERLGLIFIDQVDAFVKLAAAAKNTAMEGEGVRQIFTAVAEASTVMQLSGDSARGAIYALQQMISKGKVSAEELRRQLGDRLPGAFQLAAQAAGVTTGELDRMLKAGELISEEFLPKFALEIRKRFSGDATEAATTLQANVHRLKNSWVDLQKKFMDSGATAELTEQIIKLTKSIEVWLKDNDALIEQRIPEYIKEIKEALKGLYDFAITIDSKSLGFGVLGWALFGPGGALAFFDISRRMTQVKEDIDKGTFDQNAGKRTMAQMLMDWFVGSEYQQAIYNLDKLNKKIDEYNTRIHDIDERGGVGFTATLQEKLNDLIKQRDALEQKIIGNIGKIYDLGEKQIKQTKAQLTILSGPYADNLDYLIATVLEFENAWERIAEGPMLEYLGILKDIVDITDLYADAWKKIDGIGMAAQSEFGPFDLSGLEEMDAAASEVIDLWENTRDTIQDSIAGSLSSVMRGEFESVSDLFQNLLDNMLSAWSSMVAQMIMQGKALKGMSLVDSIGTMAGAGAILGIGSYMINESQKQSRTEKFWEEYAARIKKAEEQARSLSDTIASFELSELDYALYQVNEKYKEQIDLAKEVGTSMELVGKAMYHALQAAAESSMGGHTRLIGRAKSWIQGVERKEWGVDEYLKELGNIGNSISALDKDSSDYYEKSLILYEDQFNVLMSIDGLLGEQVDLTKRQISDIDAQIGSIDDMIFRLSSAGDLAAVQSMEGFQGRFDELFGAGDVAGLLSFIPSYLNFSGAYGNSNQGVVDYITEMLLELKGSLFEEKDALTLALGALDDTVDANTTATSVNTSSLIVNTSALIESVAALVGSLEKDRKKALVTAWTANSPMSLGYDQPGVSTGAAGSGSAWYPATQPQHAWRVATEGDYAGYSVSGTWASEMSDWTGLMSGWLATVPQNAGLNYGAINYFVKWLEKIPTHESGFPAGGGPWDPPTYNNAWSNWLTGRPEFTLYSRGGLTSGMSLAGEYGPEWVIPTYEPQRSKFLSDVGVDPETIGRSIAGHLAPLLTGNEIHISVDGREIAHVVDRQLAINRDEFRNLN